MSGEQIFHSGIPPELLGSYLIRDTDGDIIYWGDAINLYETWCSKLENIATECQSFEYALKDI